MTPHVIENGGSPRPALRTRDLAVGYRTRRTRTLVLERLNVSVDRGDFVCLLGPNGIGKSTLLRTIARMQPALSGSVELDGTDHRAMTTVDLARRLGAVLTERVAVEALSTRRIVELGRYPHSGWFGRLSERDRAVVSWAIESVGAGHLTDRDFVRLSDGERQRIMVARALAQEPALLVLDEPTAYLDVPSRVELMGVLRQLARDERLAVIVSTHDLELALRTADVIWLVMPDGELVAGAPEDVVLNGRIAAAFEGRRIRFHASERSFKLLTGERGPAVVRGSGLRADLAHAVLEREGFSAGTTLSPECAVLVDTHEHGWHAVAAHGEADGADFASLAAFLRQGRWAA